MGIVPPEVHNPPVQFTEKDQFQAKNVQRVKQTPFIDAIIYSSNPLLFVDPVDITLEEIMRSRVQSNMLLPIEEVESIIRNVVTGLSELQQKGYEAHGDINMNTVYYCKKEKFFKIVHPLFCESGFLLALQETRFTALSPEQLSQMDRNRQEVDAISIKSDIFAFGVLLTQLCTLLPMEQIYCVDTYCILDLEIVKRLNIVEEYYSTEIAHILKKCLEYDMEVRCSLQQLLYLVDKVEHRPVVRN